MTLREFRLKVRGFEWLRMMAARDRAEIIAAIGNYSGNLRKGVRLKPESMRPIPNPPNNIFFRQMFGLPC